MSSARRWRFRIRHILEAVNKIQRYTGDMREEELAANSMAVDAVIRNFQVIGEATRKLPEHVRDRYPHIPWSDMQKMRHVVVHDYDRIDVPTLWQTIQKDLPPLVEPLEKMLEESAE